MKLNRDVFPDLKELSGLIYPRRCPACHDAVPFGRGLICPECADVFTKIESPYCMKCGKSLGAESPVEKEFCRDCLKKTHYFDMGRALFRYDDPMRSSIATFKYKGRREYVLYYAGEMAKAFNSQVRIWRPEVLIPIPIHPSRKRKRGYNQAGLLAVSLGKIWNIPVDEKLLLRGRNTAAQKELSREQRMKNMKTAFILSQQEVSYERILLIDDIYTTGSTVDAAAGILKQGGAMKVYFLSLSIGSS